LLVTGPPSGTFVDPSDGCRVFYTVFVTTCYRFPGIFFLLSGGSFSLDRAPRFSLFLPFKPGLSGYQFRPPLPLTPPSMSRRAVFSQTAVGPGGWLAYHSSPGDLFAVLFFSTFECPPLIAFPRPRALGPLNWGPRPLWAPNDPKRS